MFPNLVQRGVLRGGVFIHLNYGLTFFRKPWSWWVGLGRDFVRFDPTASGKPMGHLPGPKMAITKFKNIEKHIEHEQEKAYISYMAALFSLVRVMLGYLAGGGG